MNYVIKPLDSFNEQLRRESSKSKRIIGDKIRLIKNNPYRFKRIYSERFRKAFRVRLNLDRREVRMIYVILEPNIILVCLLDRKRDYKDLEKHLNKL